MITCGYVILTIKPCINSKLQALLLGQTVFSQQRHAGSIILQILRRSQVTACATLLCYTLLFRGCSVMHLREKPGTLFFLGVVTAFLPQPALAFQQPQFQTGHLVVRG